MITTGFSKIRMVLFLAVIGTAGAWLALRWRKPVQNVILISIDTCRADYLSCYGYEHTTTPNIDAVAKQGVLFKNVTTPVPLTLPAHSSMLTGTIPPYHQVHDNLNYKLGQNNVTITEILKKKGYTTGAVVGSYILDSKFGLDQGFDEYNDFFVESLIEALNQGELIERRGGEGSRFVCEWLRKHRKDNFFFFLHYYDPHTPYEPPEPFATDYANNLYAGEIAYVDQCIGRVIKTLKSLDLYDSTLLIITSDHGELLGEHGELEHGYFLYEGAIKVPLIIRAPQMKKPKTIREIVSLVDIVPTILGYLGIPAPTNIHGKDLREYMDATTTGPAPERYLYCESFTPTKYNCNPLLSVITNNWKYIQTTRSELYNLKHDPDETENLLTTEPKRAELLQHHLHLILSEQTRTSKEESSFVLDAESRRRLESLGYVGGSIADTSFKVDPSKADPKDLVDYHVHNQKAVFLLFRKEYEKAKEICYEMLEQWPKIADTHFLLARAAFSAGDFEESITHNLQYLSFLEKETPQDLQTFDPSKPVSMVHNLLGSAYYELGEYEKAIEQFKATLQINPDQSDVIYRLGTVYYMQGKFDETIQLWNEALRVDPSLPGVRKNLEKLLAEKQRREKIISQYMEMLSQNPNDPNAHNALANEFYRQGKIEDAITHWLEVAKQRPDRAEVQNSLGTAFYRQGKNEEAVQHWSEAIRLKPDWPKPYNNLAWLLATTEDENLRNPAEAVRLAERACELTNYAKPEMLDTLAVACAASGDFEEAVKNAEKGIELARKAEHESLAEDIQSRLELYRKNKPYKSRD